MKLRRKFNLTELGHKYESITIEVNGDSAIDCIARIAACYKIYSQSIKDGKVR